MDKEHHELPESPSEEATEKYKQKWGTLKDGYNSGGYDWCVANWGTKWDVKDPTLTVLGNHGHESLHFTFDTAWSPPLPVIEHLASHHPLLALELKFWERGQGDKGLRRYKGGELQKSEDSSYKGSRGG